MARPQTRTPRQSIMAKLTPIATASLGADGAPHSCGELEICLNRQLARRPLMRTIAAKSSQRTS